MIESDYRLLSKSRQCALLAISRTALYYRSKGESALNLKLMRLMDEIHMARPQYGSRQMASTLRLWRSLKYECVYLHAFEGGQETRVGIGRWIEFYNTERPHSSLGDFTPYEAYYSLPVNGQHQPAVEQAA